MAKIVIFGATELATLCHFFLTHDSPHRVAAFTVNQDYIKEQTLCGLPVLPFETIQSTHPPDEYSMLVAIWYGRVNKTRADKVLEAKAKGYQLIRYVSSKAITWPGLTVGENSCIFAGCICQPFARIGDNVMMRDGSIVGHHALIHDHCYLAPHAVVLGGATVEPYCFIGANATIRNDVTIARESIVGAGALILEDTQEKGVYKGNPAVLLPVPSDKLKRI
jgi:sugar O-acyltransferase (sialic acid O-acetyltransferase NeuD family)